MDKVIDRLAERAAYEAVEKFGKATARRKLDQGSWRPDLWSMMFFLIWGSGWVFAQGFWSTLWSVVFPPWALYLFLERVYFMLGMIR